MGQIPRSTEHILVHIATRYNKTDRDCCYRSLLEIISPQFGKYCPPPLASGNISQTSGKQFPIVTSTPVTICIILQRNCLAIAQVHVYRNNNVGSRPILCF